MGLGLCPVTVDLKLEAQLLLNIAMYISLVNIKDNYRGGDKGLMRDVMHIFLS